jgi:hypothetical protein
MLRNERWNQTLFGLGIVVCLSAAAIFAQPAPLPQAVLTAHSVFVENETGFVELQYAAVLELSKWGHFEQAENREKADLVLLLSSGTHVHAIPDGQYPRTTGLNAFTEEAVPPGHTKVALLDPKSGATLWSSFHKTEGAKVKNGHLLDELRQAFEATEKSKK